MLVLIGSALGDCSLLRMLVFSLRICVEIGVIQVRVMLELFTFVGFLLCKTVFELSFYRCLLSVQTRLLLFLIILLDWYF